jgi:hypothetical protein
MASFRERDGRINSERQRFLLADNPIVHSPKLRAVRLDQKIQPAAIEKLDELLARLCIANGCISERHNCFRFHRVLVSRRARKTRYQQKYQEIVRLPAIMAEQT